MSFLWRSIARRAWVLALVATTTSHSVIAIEAIQPAGGNFGFLGIYADSLGTETCATIAPGASGTLYVIATTPVDPTPGFTGVEFSIQITNPTGYFFVFTPPSGGIAFGDPIDRTPENPLDRSGANIAFPFCRTGSRVVMGSIHVFNLNGAATDLRIERRYPASNPFIGNCPLFVNCISPSFEFHCMQSCDVNATGGAIAATLGLNQGDCAPRDCAAACPGAPCASVVATSPTRYCAGETITITATATNCSNEPADLDVFVQHLLSGSFKDVPAGASVVASRTYAVPGCEAIDRDPVVGVVARNNTCADPFGAEIARPMQCTMACTQNRPPDCSQAFPSDAMLWPADGSLHSVSIEGITDPDNDPVEVSLDFVFTHESPGREREPNCPDAFFDGPNAVRLRAERDLGGTGRMYRLHARATDPAGAECFAEVDVCVPRKPGSPCVEPAHFFYQANVCSPTTGRDLPRGPVIAMLPQGKVEITLPVSRAADIRIEVFDVRGRLLRLVAKARFAPGDHRVRWDGNDDAGRDVAAGVYVMRIRSGDASTHHKIVVVR